MEDDRQADDDSVTADVAARVTVAPVAAVLLSRRSAARSAVPFGRWNRGQLTSTSGSDFPAPPPGRAIEEKCETTRSSLGSSAGVRCTASRL